MPAFGYLLSPMSMLMDGNERAQGRGRAYTFPGGGITAGLHSSVFAMANHPLARPGTRQRSATAGPLHLPNTPYASLTGRRG